MSRLQAAGQVAVVPDRSGAAVRSGEFPSGVNPAGDVLLRFEEPSGRWVTVRLSEAGFDSLAFGVAALAEARRESPGR